MAGTKNGLTLLGGKGNLGPIRDMNGEFIAVPLAETDELIRIRYSDASPLAIHPVRVWFDCAPKWMGIFEMAEVPGFEPDSTDEAKSLEGMDLIDG